MRKHKQKDCCRAGAALLIVLFVVMAITVLSFGFVARSDAELMVGKNVALRMEMDYLAESALAQARGLILYPQDITLGPDGYWTGATDQQLVTPSDDYYSVEVAKLDNCDYQITSTAYQQKQGVTTAQSKLQAQLRLDPCIALWVGDSAVIPSGASIDGDVYCFGDLINNGIINGDVFANSVSGSITGQQTAVIQLDLSVPAINADDFSSTYYIESLTYSAGSVDPELSGVSLSSNSGNTAGVRYCNGNLRLAGNVTINGTLAVKGNLTVSGPANKITAARNFPALVVDGDLVIDADAALEVNGLAIVKQQVVFDPNSTSASVEINGSLFVVNGAIDAPVAGPGVFEVNADPQKAVIQTWPNPGTAYRWSPAAGAYFKRIQRVIP